MKIRFPGAADGVTGSRHLVTSAWATVLHDCGVFQGYKLHRERNWADPGPLRDAEAVVISHAHLDHSCRLPALAEHRRRGQVNVRAATRELLKVLLPDSAHLPETDARRCAARAGLADARPAGTRGYRHAAGGEHLPQPRPPARRPGGAARGAGHRTVRGGISVLLPIFAVGCAQALVRVLQRPTHAGRIPARLPIVLDGPMAQLTTELCRQHREDVKA